MTLEKYLKYKSKYLDIKKQNMEGGKINKFATKVVHGVNIIDDRTGNFITPIILGTTFSQNLPDDRPGKDELYSHGQGYFYSRMGNPTRGELEETLALIENAKHAAVFSSGMASISTVIQLLNYGDHIITMQNTLQYFLPAWHLFLQSYNF